MACNVIGGKTILLWLGLFLLVCCNGARLTGFKALAKLKGDHGRAKVKEPSHGRLIISRNDLQSAKPEGIEAMTNLMDADADYQADMDWGQPKTPEGFGEGVSGKKSGDAALDQILKMEPKVECTGNTMKLQVQDSAFAPGSLFFIDRGSQLSPLPPAKLPQSCGYSTRSTLRDLFLVAPYDGCFVALEEQNYVLPLRWLGLPVKMSCPLRQSSTNAPMVTCHADGMLVKMDCAVPVSKMKVNLDGNWEPLMKASTRCGFGVVEHPEGVVVSVRYAPCLQKKDGMYTLEVAGDGETKISCPSLLPVQPQPTKNPANVSKLQTETSSHTMHPYTPSPISMTTVAPESTPKGPVELVPELPNEKPSHSRKDMYEPHLPYLPYYPNLFYPYPANPDPKSTTTVPPSSPPITETTHAPKSQPTDPPANPQVTPEAQVPQPFFPFPFYPWTTHPKRPGTEQPRPYGKENNVYPYLPHVKQPNPEGFPSAPRSEPVPSTVSPNAKTNDQRWYPFYNFPVYPQPDKLETSTEPSPVTSPPNSQNNLSPTIPEQPMPINPTVAEEFKGAMYQPFYPYIWSKGHYEMPLPPSHPTPTPTPTTKCQDEQSSSPLEPDTPENVSLVKPSAPGGKEPLRPHTSQGQIYQPFYPYPFYQWPAPEQLPNGLPTAVPVPPETKAPQAHVSKPFKPQPEPENEFAKPPNPPQPKDPQGQVYRPFYPYPFYQWPAPEQLPNGLPTAVPVPTETKAPQAHVSKPFKPQPEPENEFAKPPNPPQPKDPRGQVYQPFHPYPFYQWPAPEQLPDGLPTAVPVPPETKAPSAHVSKPFKPQPEPENEFAKPPNPPQPKDPRGQVYQPFHPYPFYQWPAPEQLPDGLPTAVPVPPETKSPQAHVSKPFKPQPEPENEFAKPPNPPQPKDPRGQVYQPFHPYPFYQWPAPEQLPDGLPTAVPVPPETKAPQAPVSKPFKPQPEPENELAKPPNPPQPKDPQGQVYRPFYPYPFYQWPAPEQLPDGLPTAVPVPPETKAPQAHVSKPFNPQPEPNNEVAKPPNLPKPEDPRGQVYQPFYPYPFYQQPAPEKLPTAVPVPPASKPPQSPVSQPSNLQPEPENKPDEKPNAVPKPPKQSQPESPQGQLYYPFSHNPFFPNFLYPQPNHPDEIHTDPSESSEMPGTDKEEVSNEKPAPSVQPPAVNPPVDRGPHSFNPYYYLHPPQSVTLGPATSKQQPHVNTPASGQKPTKSTIPQPGGMLPQAPQPGSLYRPPVECPSFCRPGFFNCCPQIAFHQHHHHIVPALPGSKDVPPIYTGLPFLPPVVYSGFGNGLGVTPQNPTETFSTSTPATMTTQSPSGNENLKYLPPPGGNTATPSSGNPLKPTNPDQHMYPYFVPNSLYPSWPYPPLQEGGHNLPQGKSPPHNSMASKTLATIIPMLRHDPYKMLSPKQEIPSAGNNNNPSGLDMSFSKLPIFNTESSGFKWPKNPNLQSGRDLVSYYMLQDAESYTPNKTAVPHKSSQPSAMGSKNPARHEQTLNTYSEPENYVLLQSGPPGSEPNVFSASPLPFRHIVHDAIFPPQNLAKNKGSKGQTSQQSEGQSEGMSNSLPSDVNTIVRPGVDSGSLPSTFSASNNPHSEPLQQDPSLSAPSLKPNFLNSFKRSWKPMTPQSPSQWIPPHVPRKAFQQWRPAAQHKENGSNQHIQKGHQKQKGVSL